MAVLTSLVSSLASSMPTRPAFDVATVSFLRGVQVACLEVGKKTAMKPGRWVVAGLPALLAAVLCWGCQNPSQHTVDLLQAFDGRYSGTILYPEHPLGEDLAMPFLGAGWALRDREADPNAQTRRALEGAELRFYLEQVLPLVVELQGLDPQGRQLRALVNGNALSPQPQMGDRLETFRFSVPVEFLIQGENLVRLDQVEDSLWKTFKVEPADAVEPLYREQPAQPAAEGPWLLLPFHRAVHLSSFLGEDTRLHWDEIEPWYEPGAPLETVDWRLQVSCVGDDFERKGQLDPSVTAPLPIGDPGQVCQFTLLAQPYSRPPRGMLGLKLSRPRLSFAGAVPTESSPEQTTKAAALEAARVNILVYLVDTLRADRLGCYGYERPTSPALDRFATEAVLFEDAIAQSPWTKPSVASMFTSLPPERHRVQDFGDKLPSEVETLAESLQVNGYQTAAIVTNNLVDKMFDFDQGFDTYQLFSQERAKPLNQKVLRWLDSRQPEKPFFLYVHTLDPHAPYDPPASFREHWAKDQEAVDNEELRTLSRRALRRAQRRRQPLLEDGLLQRMRDLYDGEIAANDAAFKELLEQLKERGLYDNTIIVFVSDHGEEFMDHRGLGHLHSLYEELLRIPCVIRFPGGGAARVQGNFQHVDLAPTLLANVGIQPPPSMQGRAYLPGLPWPEVPARFSARVGPDAPVYQKAGRPWLFQARGVRFDNQVLLHTEAAIDNRSRPVEYYDLSSDPGQQLNRAYSHSLQRRRLEALLPERTEEGSDKVEQEKLAEQLRALHYLR